MVLSPQRAPSSPGRRLPVAIRRTLCDQIADLVRDAIISGVLPAGHPLRQEELAARFGISRVPLREALRRLEAEGFVEMQRYRGATVRGLSTGEIQQVIAIRTALETMAIDLAISHLDDELLGRLHDLVLEMESCRNPTRYIALQDLFYASLYGAAGWPLLLEMIQQVQRHGQRYIHAMLPLFEDRPLPIPPLCELLALCRTRDRDGAKTWLNERLRQVGERMIETYSTLKAQKKTSALLDQQPEQV